MSMPSTAHLNLTALCREGRLKEVLHFLLTTHKPTSDSRTYLQLLQLCIAKNSLPEGKQVHSLITDNGFAFAASTFFQNKLINMYVKCGSLVDGRKVFDDMIERDSVSWNGVIAGYRRHGYPQEVLALFHQMQRTGVQPDQLTFASVVSACAEIRALEKGMDIHQIIMEMGFLSDVVVASALLDMYVKWGSVQKARELFDKMPQRNVVSWNSMITGYTQNGALDQALSLLKEMPRSDVVSWNAMVAGYTQNGFAEEALEAFKQMQLAGLKPNATTFASILPAYAKKGSLEQGMAIHQSIIESGLSSDVIVASALLDMYAKRGFINKACKLFDKMSQRNVISWTAMVSGYAHNGFSEEALESFKQMQLVGVKPNSTTFASILSTSAKVVDLEQGREIHQRLIESGYLSDVVVLNALIDMYAKYGSILKARELFDKMFQRNVVSWTALISGYAKNGLVEKALETFKQMQSAGVKPNSATIASILPACAKIGALEQGMNIHQSIIEGGFLADVVVVNALIDMYAKCGSMQKAVKLFDKTSQRDVISWTAMIAGYAQNGLVEKALETFRQMELAGVKPNSTTFASILPACAKMGALEQGMDIHQSIIEIGLLSDVVVVNALIDMYAKCGSIQKAHELFDKMSQRDVVSWTALIAGHAGLVDEGCKYFNGVSDSYCITPIIDHYVCMVDLLARAGNLEETLNFIIKMPTKPEVVVWICLLDACRSHKNIGLGVFTTNILSELDPKNAATYVLMSNIYAEVGKWDEVQKVRRLMKDKRIKKIPGCSWIEVHKMVHAFCVGDT
ncbi:pentatricopeptide repeat-containing protein At1g15510, chloroplastic [Cryptomeria japonica]|uniref:pentatricopeptide repeat-containing protein At1g15510, chloroplastic n=1 Tax=Cryptomeria japonica TaxID=3369 RepID=UPI0025AD18F2|nr:pentatricopeptide repeat-containing protein At1g15510, chloroplastic [Cryptomeria japonica]